MKRIFLTGASSGIGLATARALTDAGHKVWGTSRQKSRLPQLRNFHPVVLDLNHNESIAPTFNEAVSEASAFDVVINNAGSGHFGPAELLLPAQLQREFQALVFGQIELTRHALIAMRKRRAGLIINVTSLASRIPVPFMASYNAAKAAFAVFTMSLQLELRDSGVKLVDLQPADIRTNFNDVATRLETAGTGYEEAGEKTWRVVDRNMRKAPAPELVARRIVQLIDGRNPPPQITVGGFFQARIAPFLLRFLPMRVQLWGIRNYYDL